MGTCRKLQVGCGMTSQQATYVYAITVSVFAQLMLACGVKHRKQSFEVLAELFAEGNP